MKKILASFVIILIIVFVFSFSYHIDASTENETFDIISSIDENNYNEFNDNYNDAINLSPCNYYLYDSYKVELNGTLNIDLIDIDFYYFKILTDCQVSIEAISLSNYDFELAVLYNECIKIRNNNAYHDLVTKFDGYEHSKRKEYEALLKAGTYYIVVRGIENQDIINSYDVTLKVRKTDDFPEYNISQLRHRNIKGVIWASDLIPGGSVSLFNLCETITYYQKSETNLDIPNYALDDLRVLSNGSSINVYNYFLWDPLIMYLLREAYVSILNELNTTFAEYEEVTLDLRIVENKITKAIELVGNIAGYVLDIVLFDFPDTLIEIGVDALVFGLNRIFDLLLPKISVNTLSYYGFLNGLVNALDLGVNSNDLEVIQNWPTSQPLVIPIYYSLDVEENGFSNFTKYTFTFNNSIEEYMNDYSFIYDENKQERFDETNYYCRGKLYAITDYDELFDISNLDILTEDLLSEHVFESYTSKIVDDSYHFRRCSCGFEKYERHAYLNHICVICYYHQFVNATYEYVNENEHIAICECGTTKNELHSRSGHYCELCNGTFGNHSYDASYVWISNTKHKSYCSCGVNKNEGHAIRGNSLKAVGSSEICILCGGTANIGFIEIKNISNISKNGSILLNNGIIILEDNDLENYMNSELLFFDSNDELLNNSKIIMYLKQNNLNYEKEEKD